jgi:hypothetical protein
MQEGALSTATRTQQRDERAAGNEEIDLIKGENLTAAGETIELSGATELNFRQRTYDRRGFVTRRQFHRTGPSETHSPCFSRS